MFDRSRTYKILFSSLRKKIIEILVIIAAGRLFQRKSIKIDCRLKELLKCHRTKRLTSFSQEDYI